MCGSHFVALLENRLALGIVTSRLARSAVTESGQSALLWIAAAAAARLVSLSLTQRRSSAGKRAYANELVMSPQTRNLRAA